MDIKFTTQLCTCVEAKDVDWPPPRKWNWPVQYIVILKGSYNNDNLAHVFSLTTAIISDTDFNQNSLVIWKSSSNKNTCFLFYEHREKCRYCKWFRKTPLDRSKFLPFFAPILFPSRAVGFWLFVDFFFLCNIILMINLLNLDYFWLVRYSFAPCCLTSCVTSTCLRQTFVLLNHQHQHMNENGSYWFKKISNLLLLYCFRFNSFLINLLSPYRES